jgi:hypothetical protein
VNLTEAAIDYDANNDDIDGDVWGFETRDKFYTKRRQQVLDKILELTDSL